MTSLCAVPREVTSADDDVVDASRDARTIDVACGLNFGHLDESHRVTRVLDAALKDALGEAQAPLAFPSDDILSSMRDEPAFSEAHFGLSAVRLYREASDDLKRAIVKRASDAMLTEAYFIEKLGLAYGAKMVLLAETTEERMLYALFGADEARHLALVAPWLDETHTRTTTSPFHALLARVIEEGDRATMVFLIQVVLEGWGITHYRGLTSGARDPGLKTALTSVLADEARHHGSGHVLFAERGLTTYARTFSEEIMRTLLGMVQIGPASLVGAIDVVMGGLSRAQKCSVLAELDGPAHARERLALLKKLMGTTHAAPLVSLLDDAGLFAPLAIDVAAGAM
jgi:hypothetical protein